jgi:hypothetical protein
VREAASGKEDCCKLFAVRCSLLAARCFYTQLMIGLFFSKKFKRNGRKEPQRITITHFFLSCLLVFWRLHLMPA